jgi:transcriptional regulator with XRE-family HTH domain
LPLPPRLELESDKALIKVREGGSASLRYAADRNGLPSRAKTARELTIGRKLRELRDQRHLTQQDMATKAGVPRTYISRIENARLLPGPVMLRRIADALEVGILDLLPQSKNGPASGVASSLPAVGLSSAEETYWTTLSGSFLQLRPDEKLTVLDHVRRLAGENSSHDFAAMPAMMAR